MPQESSGSRKVMNRRAVTAVCSSWINNTGGAAAWPSLSRSSTSSHMSGRCVCTDPCSVVLAHESVQYWAASRTPVLMLTDGRITRRDNETGLEPDVEDRIEAEIHPRSWRSTEKEEKCWSPSAFSSEQSHSPVWSSFPSVKHHVEASIKKKSNIRELMSPVWGLQQKPEVRREARTWWQRNFLFITLPSVTLPIYGHVLYGPAIHSPRINTEGGYVAPGQCESSITWRTLSLRLASHG